MSDQKTNFTNELDRQSEELSNIINISIISWAETEKKPLANAVFSALANAEAINLAALPNSKIRKEMQTIIQKHRNAALPLALKDKDAKLNIKIEKVN